MPANMSQARLRAAASLLYQRVQEMLSLPAAERNIGMFFLGINPSSPELTYILLRAKLRSHWLRRGQLLFQLIRVLTAQDVLAEVRIEQLEELRQFLHLLLSACPRLQRVKRRMLKHAFQISETALLARAEGYLQAEQLGRSDLQNLLFLSIYYDSREKKLGILESKFSPFLADRLLHCSHLRLLFEMLDSLHENVRQTATEWIGRNWTSLGFSEELVLTVATKVIHFDHGTRTATETIWALIILAHAYRSFPIGKCRSERAHILESIEDIAHRKSGAEVQSTARDIHAALKDLSV